MAGIRFAVPSLCYYSRWRSADRARIRTGV